MSFRELLDEIIKKTEEFDNKPVEYREFFDYVEPPQLADIRIECLDEATRASVGKFVARRDQPHFSGDEYHGHCDVGGGCKVAWTVTGQRRHPNKFPAHIPKDAKAAVAKVLGVSPEMLESFWIDDGDRRKLLLEVQSKR